MAQNYRIRPMQRAELDFAIDAAAGEGWNPGLHDADAFFAADPEGFLVGLLNNEPIGCVSAVRYDRNFGFLGFYIIMAACRGSGYGLSLWQAAMQQLGARNIGLDGVIEQQANYRRSGFRFAYSNIRHVWRNRPAPPTPPPAIAVIGADDTDLIADYDRTCFPAPRPAFLGAWLSLPDARALAWREDGELHGYGVIRRCREGWKVGPLCADSRRIAAPLLLALSDAVAAEEPIYVDAPEVNPEAMALASEYGMQEVFATARMYNRAAPEWALERVFSATSFELG